MESATQIIMMNTITLAYMILVGIQISAAVLVGREIGASNL
jgi:Na+-driven multidrug efflux pump